MRLELLALDAARLDALAGGGAAAVLAGLCTPPPARLALVRQVAAATRGMHAAKGGVPAAPWTGYLALELPARRLVGTCAFKGAPAGGEVEIAYCTFPGEEARGVAGAMAARLLAIAAAAPGLARVVAHTAPAEGASPRLLRRLGFAWRGVVRVPEDGEVWRWEKPLAVAGGARPAA